MTAAGLLIPDCGPGVGLGHLERMLALADALRPDVSVAVVVPAGDVAVLRRVADRGHATRPMAGSAAERALAASDQAPADVIVIDGYPFDATVQRRLRDRAALVVVDDLGAPTACDVAVNPAPGGEAKRPDGADVFLGGAAYALLSLSVVEARDTGAAGAGRRSVLVSTGATDATGLTARVAAELLDHDATVEVVVVVGPEMDRAALPDHPRLTVLLAPSTLAGALAAATVFTGAAGTTAVQAACVGVPAVITAVVPNQLDQATALAAAGCALLAPSERLAGECLRLLDDPGRRTEMGRRGRELVDGQGAARVADCVRRLVHDRAA